MAVNGGGFWGVFVLLIELTSTTRRFWDGVVSKDEFRSTLYKLNIAMTEAQVERVFAVFDANQDGVLDYSEFCEELAAKDPKNNVMFGDGNVEIVDVGTQ